MPPVDFDAILAKITEPAAGADASAESSLEKLIQLEKLRQEAQDRRDAREREERREERAEAARAETNKLFLGLATALLPSLLKKETDPALMALISNLSNKNGGSEEMKAILEMQRQQSAATMELQLKSLLSVIATKDELNKKVLEDVMNRQDEAEGGNSSGIAGIMKEVRLGLGTVGSMLGGARAPEPAQPLAINPPADGGQPAQPQQQQPQQRRAPVLVVLHQLKALQEGKVQKPLIARAAMVTVALQDEGLIEALLADDEDEVYAYCLPHVKGDPALIQWLQSAGVGEWLKNYLETQLIPQVDMAVNGLEDDTEEPADTAPEAPPTQHQPAQG